MAELFEDMEKMDIQAERRKTEEQRQRAENAEHSTQHAIENGIRFLIETAWKFSIPKDALLNELTEKYQLTPETATQKLEQYWKS